MQLARPNFPIPNARHGDGCFEGLTSADLGDFELWNMTPPQEPALPPEEKIEKKKRRHAQYTLLSPSWLDAAPSSLRTAIQHPWTSLATPEPVEHPNVIKFSVERKLTGVAWLRDLPQGLALWWLEYAPWAVNYKNAELSLLFYAIAESIQLGHAGRILIRPTVLDARLFRSLGCRRTSDGAWLELSAEDAWRAVMSKHRVPGPVIDLILEQGRTGDADVAWIVDRIGRESLIPRFIEAFTQLPHGLNWLSLKQLAAERGNLPPDEEAALRHKIRDVEGALAVRNLFKGRGAVVRYSQDTPILGLVIRFRKMTSIKGGRGYDPALDEVVENEIVLPAYEDVLVLSKVWSKADHSQDTLKNIDDMQAKTSSRPMHKILATSRDFEQLDQAQQKLVVRGLTQRGVQLLVLKYKATQAQGEVKELLRRLNPRIKQSDSDERF